MIKYFFKKSKIITLLIIFAISASISYLVFSYDGLTTHSALAVEAVKLFNNSYPNLSLSQQEMNWIVQGSTDEDTVPRWINHFYDPVYNQGWTGEGVLNVSSSTLRWFSKIVFSDYPPVSSKYWAQLSNIQAQYKDFGGNRTWQRAVYELAKNNDKYQAYYTLGHILHLIQDSTVPEHTRNDTHPPASLQFITKDEGSPYETYLKKYYRNQDGTNLPVTAHSLVKDGIKPILRNSLNEYFDALANYSNRYFFSKDTIPVNPLANASEDEKKERKYRYPEIINDDGQLGFGIDVDNSIYPLAKVKDVAIDGYNIKRSYVIEIIDKNILDSYFSRLSREAIINSAGLIKFFFDEVNKIQTQNSPLADLPKEVSGVNSVLSNLALTSLPKSNPPQTIYPATGTISTVKSTPSPYLMVTNPQTGVDGSLLLDNSMAISTSALLARVNVDANFIPTVEKTPSLTSVELDGIKSAIASAAALVNQVGGQDTGSNNSAAMALALSASLGALGYTLRPKTTNENLLTWEIIKQVPRTIYENTIQTVTKLVPVTKTVYDAVTVTSERWVQKTSSAVTMVPQAVTSLGNNVKSALSNLVSPLLNAGGGVLGGIWQSVSNSVQQVANYFYQNVVQPAVNFVTAPLKVLVPIVKNTTNWVKETYSTVKQVPRQVTEYVKKEEQVVVPIAKTVYDDVVVGEVSAQIAVPPKKEEASPFVKPATPPNLYRRIYTHSGSTDKEYIMVIGGVQHPVSDPQEVERLFGNIYDKLPIPPNYATTAGGHQSLLKSWQMQYEVFTSGALPATPEAYARGEQGTGHHLGWKFEPRLMYNPHDNTIYTVDSFSAADFYDRFGFLNISNDTPRDNVSLAVYITPEDFAKNRPSLSYQPLFPQAAQAPTAFQTYFNQQKALGRSAYDILHSNPFMAGQNAITESQIATQIQNITLPFINSMTSAQKNSIIRMLNNRGNKNELLNETDAKNMAFSLGRLTSWQQFAGKTASAAVALAQTPVTKTVFAPTPKPAAAPVVMPLSVAQKYVSFNGPEAKKPDNDIIDDFIKKLISSAKTVQSYHSPVDSAASSNLLSVFGQATHNPLLAVVGESISDIAVRVALKEKFMPNLDWSDVLFKLSSGAVHELEDKPMEFNYFYDRVRSGGAWDYKVRDYSQYKDTGVYIGGVSAGETTIYNHYRADITGNIGYGYAGAAAGFSLETLLQLGGLAQKNQKTTQPDWTWAKSYYDDPYDQSAITAGFNLWNANGTAINLNNLSGLIASLADGAKVVKNNS